MKSPSAVRLQSLYSGLSSCWAQVPSRFLWSWMGGCVAALWARACQWQALSAPGRRHRLRPLPAPQASASPRESAPGLLSSSERPGGCARPRLPLLTPVPSPSRLLLVSVDVLASFSPSPSNLRLCGCPGSRLQQASSQIASAGCGIQSDRGSNSGLLPWGPGSLYRELPDRRGSPTLASVDSRNIQAFI